MVEAFKVDVHAYFKDRLDRLREALRDPSDLTKQIGALGVGSAQRAFKDQALGNLKWPARYEGMAPPFINIAGALQDFNAGRKKPKPNRFVDRPALIDEGMRGGMLGTLTFQSRNPFVAEWGSDKPYALGHQLGLPSEVRVSETGYRLGQAWLMSPEKTVGPLKTSFRQEAQKLYDKYNFKDQKFRDRVKHIVEGKSKTHRITEQEQLDFMAGNAVRRKEKAHAQKQREANPSAYMDKLWPSLFNRVHRLRLAPRPFLGVTDMLGEDLVKRTEAFFQGRMRRAS
jgi:hypothetical protein